MVSICTKRSFNFTNEESSQNQFSAKRSCARSDEQQQPINEELRQVAAVLQGAGLVSGSAEELLGENFLFRSPSFWTADQRAWAAFGELNLIQANCPQQFSEVSLLSYHSFTRSTKDNVFSRLCSSQCVYPETLARGQGPLHLRMIFHVLQHAYQSYAEVSVVVSSFHPPQSATSALQNWCAKWGFRFGPRERLTLYTVNAYGGYVPIGLGTQPPVRALLVPDFASAPAFS